MFLTPAHSPQYGRHMCMPPKISDSDKDVINTKLDEVTGWLDANQQQAEADKFREMLREAEAICNPIVTKLYQDARKVCSRKGQIELEI